MGGLVYDETAGRRVGLVPGKPTGAAVDLQQAVDSLRCQASGLGEPLCCSSGWGAQQAFDALCAKDHQDHDHERGFLGFMKSYRPMPEHRRAIASKAFPQLTWRLSELDLEFELQNASRYG